MAADRESFTRWHLSKPLCTRRGPQLVLRGKKLWKGAIILFHNGRAMPAGSFDNANSINDGGPLAVAGADANGGLRLIARTKRVTFTIVDAMVTGVDLQLQYNASGDLDIVANTTVASMSAIKLANAIRAHAIIRQLVDVNYTGTGGGFVAAFSTAAVPFVGIAGICKKTVDNSADTSNDLDVSSSNFYPMEFDLGSPYMVPAASTAAPAAANVGGIVSIADDWTLSTVLKPLQVALPLVDFSPEFGPAVDLLGQTF